MKPLVFFLSNFDTIREDIAINYIMTVILIDYMIVNHIQNQLVCLYTHQFRIIPNDFFSLNFPLSNLIDDIIFYKQDVYK